MPVQSFAVAHHGEIERAHRIGVAKEAILFQRCRNEFHQRIPFEQLSHRRIAGKLIVSDDTDRGRLEKFTRMIVRPGRIRSFEVGRARDDAVIRARRERIALAHEHRDRVRLEKSGQFAGTSPIELIAAMTRQLARGVTAQVEYRVAFEIDQIGRRPAFINGLRLHAVSDLVFRPYDRLLISTIAKQNIVLRRSLQRMLPEKVQHRGRPFLGPSRVIAKTNQRSGSAGRRLHGSLWIGPA